MTNCRNCGAPLRSCVCAYCGTYYPELQTVVVVACESTEDIELGKPGEILEIPSGVTISELDAALDNFRAVARASMFSLGL